MSRKVWKIEHRSYRREPERVSTFVSVYLLQPGAIRTGIKYLEKKPVLDVYYVKWRFKK